ncbi:MAG: DegT/DnrJ/EryC1/StrS family aminotransferase [Verrucomicrobia bacterium]|nr:DegT/DnrJ/EryC1/StrS family aminotransferase [Verrucomicrobiota bacterium]
MKTPLLDLLAQNSTLEPELQTAFMRVLRSGQYILGAEVQGFEASVARMIGVRHAIGVSSGTDAILLALMTLGIGAGDEVICPSFTFFATAGCVARVGAKPVFVDSCPVCFNLDIVDVARKVTTKTKAIIPVHLFGQAAEMDGLMRLAAEHKLAVIEDAAQSLGARYKERFVGGIGTFGTFSFFPSKNLGGFGDSGMLVTNDDALADKARIFRTHGSQPKYYHKYVGGNFRIDPLQAALLSVKLPHCQSYSLRRSANAGYYTEQLRGIPGVAIGGDSECCCQVQAARINARASKIDAGLILPSALQHNEHIWNQYTLRVIGQGRREKLRAFLTAKEIGTEIYYPVPMHAQECFAHLGVASSSLPWATRLAQEVLSIPVYPELANEQKEYVCASIREFFQA